MMEMALRYGCVGRVIYAQGKEKMGNLCIAANGEVLEKVMRLIWQIPHKVRV